MVHFLPFALCVPGLDLILIMKYLVTLDGTARHHRMLPQYNTDLMKREGRGLIRVRAFTLRFREQK